MGIKAAHPWIFELKRVLIASHRHRQSSAGDGNGEDTLDGYDSPDTACAGEA
jgi:hypothetical protein